MIAVTGATGQLGRLVIDALKARGAAPLALVRSPEKAADLGVAARVFDYDRPGTLEPALAGVATLVLISGSDVGQRVRQHGAVIAAARAAGVARIVYTSILHADSSPLSLADEHRATEAMLAESGLAVTLLRNGWYTENYAGAIAQGAATGEISAAAGTGRISSAARADYAEAAAVVALDDVHAGRTYELAGDDAWTMADLAAEVARQSGRAVRYVDLDEAAYAKVLEGAGLPAGLAAVFAGISADTAKDSLYDAGKNISRLIERPTTPLASTVAMLLGS